MKYRAKSDDTSDRYITYTYGLHHGKPLEDSTMVGLARAIAYLYHRHGLTLYESKNGKTFQKVDKGKQLRFDHIMDDEFTFDEYRG